MNDQTFGTRKSQFAIVKEEPGTKSMQKYEKELKFKNRILKEKEKAIFNQGMMKKLSK